jgi:hypothetical protein
MKTIYKGQSDLYYRIKIKDASDELLLPSDLHAFVMQFYTTNPQNFVEFDKSDLYDENLLHISASALEDLEDGALKIKFLIGISDENYDDGSYDVAAERLTGYFLKSNKLKKNA